MNILVITKSYPFLPGKGGGYAQLCEEVTDGLFERGHKVTVLTSNGRMDNEYARPYPVHRLLHIEPNWHNNKPIPQQFFFGRHRREQENLTCLQHLVTQLKPNVIFVWHILGLSRMLFEWVEHLHDVHVAFYLADYTLEKADEYIVYWRSQPTSWAAKVLKKPLAPLALRVLANEGRPISLKYENTICVSEYVRNRLVSYGIIPNNATVIYNGVNLTRFSATEVDFSTGLNCLIAGRVTPEKGIHTVIKALALLHNQKSTHQIKLTILGDGPFNYLRQLHENVDNYGLRNCVEFQCSIPREQMPQKLAQYNTLILPSEWPEPLARSMQEAMAMGLLVIGTNTGGSNELLVHERTGLVFQAGKPESLAAQLIRAMDKPQYIKQLVSTGQQEVKKHFDIQCTINQVEQYLFALFKDKQIVT